MTRTRAAIAGVLTALLLTAIGVGVTEASAAPITCPDSQTATQIAPGQFACVNNGGNADNSGQTKNPND